MLLPLCHELSTTAQITSHAPIGNESVINFHGSGVHKCLKTWRVNILNHNKLKLNWSRGIAQNKTSRVRNNLLIKFK